MIFVATKMVEQQKFPLFPFGAVVGSGIDKNQDPGSGINIPGSATLALVLGPWPPTSFYSVSSQNQRTNF
jgi:hypothetical protein